MNRFWCLFFIFWPTVAVLVCLMAPGMNWWFPGESYSPLGKQIDDLFYLILWIVTIVFIGTQAALGYVLWQGSGKREGKALFTHGSHNLEVIWTVVPAAILLFIALYQMDVWAAYRLKSRFPEETKNEVIAEVTARQFEWRIRYPGPGTKFRNQADINDWLRRPRPDDLYAVNDLHVPSGRPVLIQLRTEDVQHSFFLPELRVKSDALPGQVIPVWFEASQSREYALLCAELCGWGHYKMKARLVAEPEAEYRKWLVDLQRRQNEDGTPQQDTPDRKSEVEQ